MKVLVGMSGGVDSSVAALILKNAGYEVAGATFRLLEDDSLLAIEDAKRVADALNIPHYVFDFRKEFKESVTEYFLSEYTKGRTPNPCIMCNKNIKFGLFLSKAKELGFDAIATGHYARTDGEHLYMAKNKAKDQSYVLYNLTKDMLPFIRFPLEDKSKTEIRAMAKWANLPVAEKPDSQDICFIPDKNTKGFLDAHISSEKGDFLDAHGKVLGTHEGITHYTVGQRKGLGLSLPEPLYVGRISAKENSVTLVKNEELYRDSLFVRDFNWVSGEEPRFPGFLTCKIRYAHTPALCTAGSLPGGRVRIIFDTPQRAITPGQSAVLYDGEELIGGGIIE